MDKILNESEEKLLNDFIKALEDRGIAIYDITLTRTKNSMLRSVMLESKHFHEHTPNNI